MRYIRTKDGRIVKHPHPNADVFTFRYEILKTADTIEELIDTFVIKYAGDYLPCNIGLRLPKKSWKRFWEENRPEFIYGAIWTDKGLIYVAKMNEKGELELL